MPFKDKEVYKKYLKDRYYAKQNVIRELKNKPCADCKKSYHHCQMQFDHLGEKSFQISRRVCCKIEKIMAEVAKCEVVCANCHALRSFSRLQ